jgi:hypothetical protein
MTEEAVLREMARCLRETQRGSRAEVRPPPIVHFLVAAYEALANKSPKQDQSLAGGVAND